MIRHAACQKPAPRAALCSAQMRSDGCRSTCRGICGLRADPPLLCHTLIRAPPPQAPSRSPSGRRGPPVGAAQRATRTTVCTCRLPCTECRLPCSQARHRSPDNDSPPAAEHLRCPTRARVARLHRLGSVRSLKLGPVRMSALRILQRSHSPTGHHLQPYTASMCFHSKNCSTLA